MALTVAGAVNDVSGNVLPVSGSCESIRRVPDAGRPFLKTCTSRLNGCPGGTDTVLNVLGCCQPGSNGYVTREEFGIDVTTRHLRRTASAGSRP